MNTFRTASTFLGIILIFSLAIGQNNSAMAASGQDSALTKQMTGMISDSICKGLHVYKAHTQSSCAHDCVQLKGADYVLVVGPTVYTLQGNKAELEKFAGGRATVTGQVNGNTIAAQSVTAAKRGA